MTLLYEDVSKETLDKEFATPFDGLYNDPGMPYQVIGSMKATINSLLEVINSTDKPTDLVEGINRKVAVRTANQLLEDLRKEMEKKM